MIISRTPFRISLFGGGTDYPGWYREHGGAVVGTAIRGAILPGTGLVVVEKPPVNCPLFALPETSFTLPVFQFMS